MANTFKFGNGNWAVKDGYALAYNDENNNFKPLPFDFTRASNATRVNKQGLIETVGSGKPRIDFLDNTSGHLLIEPNRTNYSIYSQDTSTWTYTEFGSGSAGTITTGKTDMFGGTNAVQIDFPADAENVTVRFGHTTSSISSGSAQTSLYIKLVGSDISDKIIQFRIGTDVELTTISGDSFVRYTKTHTKVTNEAFNIKLRPSEGTSSGGFSIIICHPQEEVGSYATSYIPTEGSSVTRVVEYANDAGNSQVFDNDTGVWFIDLERIGLESGRAMMLANSSGSEQIRIHFDTTAQIRFRDGKASFATIGGNISMGVGTRKKVALKIDGTTLKVFADGSQVGSNYTRPTAFDIHSMYAAEDAFKLFDARFYNTALSDTELQQLTS